MAVLTVVYWVGFVPLHGVLGNPTFLLGMVLCVLGGALLGARGAVVVVLITVVLDSRSALFIGLDRETSFWALALAIAAKLVLGVGTGMILDSRRRLRDANARLTREVKAREQTERALLRSKDLHRALVESLGEGVGVFDADDRFRFANQALATMLDVSAEDLLGRCFTELITEETREAVSLAGQHPVAPRTYEVTLKATESTVLLVTETTFERSDWDDALTLRVIREQPTRATSRRS